MADDMKEFFDKVKEIYLSHKTMRLGQAIWSCYDNWFTEKYHGKVFDTFYMDSRILNSLKAYFKLCLSDESEPMLNEYLDKLKQQKNEQNIS